MRMKQLLVASTLFLLVPFFAMAAPTVVISEVAWAGSALSTADEWFELCAAPGTDLSGWTIEGASSAPMTFAPGSVVGASGAFLVANYGAGDAKTTLAVSPDLVTTSVALSNAALFLTLRDAGGAVVDMAGAPGTAPFAGTSGAGKASMERLDAALDGGTPEAWASTAASLGFVDGANELGTPGSCVAPSGSASSSPSMPEPEPSLAPVAEMPALETSSAADAPTDTPSAAVRISEIYPSPLSGEKEWVELVNRGDVGEILDGWTIADAAGTATKLEGLMLPWARLLIIAPKGSLNNDGDAIVLKDARGRVVDSVAYGKIRKGEAVMRAEWLDTLVVTRTPTPGEANVMTEEAAEPEPASGTPVPAMPPEPTPSPLPLRPDEARGGIPPVPNDASTPLSAPLGMTKDLSPLPSSAPKTATAKPEAASPAPKKAARAYKGDAYTATVLVPPGVYAKTRMFVLLGGELEELRLSKGMDAWKTGDRLAFVAQRKTEGAVAFLLANPNSARVTGSASAVFATIDAWPSETGGVRFTAEVAAVKGGILEIALGGVEGDVLLPSGLAPALKPGDAVEIEGFVAPGARPRVVLPNRDALRLAQVHARPTDATRAATLPWPAAAGLTGAAGTIGLSAYLRQQRLKRAALTRAAIEPDDLD